jgi:hypothetical protein
MPQPLGNALRFSVECGPHHRVRLQVPDNRRRDARHEGRGSDVACHDCAGRNDGIRADTHTRQDRCGSSDPHIRVDRDRLRSDKCASLFGLHGMTRRDQVDLVSDHHLVCDVDSSVTREHAVVTDEDGPPDSDVQAAIRIEGRDERESVTYDKTNLPAELIMSDYFSVRDEKIVSLTVIRNQPSPY